MKVLVRVSKAADAKQLPGNPRPGEWISAEFDNAIGGFVIADVKTQRISILSGDPHFDRFKIPQRQIGNKRIGLKTSKRKQLSYQEFLKRVA